MKTWQILRKGIHLAARKPKSLVFLYLINLISAVLLALLPASDLFAFAHKPVAAQAANGIPSWMILESLTSAINQTAQASPLHKNPFFNPLSILLIISLLPPLSGLPTWLLGGPFYDLTREEATPVKIFLANSWHWFLPFSAFSIILAIIGALSIALFSFAAFVLYPLLGDWILLPLGIFGFIFWLILYMWGEIVRMKVVYQRRRNIFRQWLPAITFLFRNISPVAVLYFASTILVPLTSYGLGGLLLSNIPLSWWILVLVLQQSLIVLRLLIHVTRWASLSAALGYPNKESKTLKAYVIPNQVHDSDM